MTPDFAELFAFCDLHTSRWAERRQAPWTQVWTRGFLSAPLYYDRQGFPIPAVLRDGAEIEAVLVWAQMRELDDRALVRVARDDLPDGSWLSTVWLGLDQSFGVGRPLIFETMRFPGNDFTEMEFPDPYDGEMTTQVRYATEEEALAAHHEIVRRIRIREGH